jgi:spermidine synthase
VEEMLDIPRQKLLLLPLFFLSGLSALIYEVIWARMLSLVFGSTVEAVSAVVTAFMFGLALGSYLGGKWVDRYHDTIRIYAFVELLIGLLSLSLYFIIITLPDAFHAIRSLTGISSSAFQGASYVFEFLLVALPATLMGATFPLMVKAYISSRNYIGEGTSLIYATNTFGAVLGALLTGFFLIPSFGIRATVAIAASINLLLAITSLLIRRYHPAWASGISSAPVGDGKLNLRELIIPSPPPLVAWSMFTVLSLSGFVAMAYQVAWTRLLTMVIGNSVYAFSAILTTFLAGLAIGSLLFVRQIDKVRDKLLLLGVVQATLFLTVILSLPMMDSLPLLFIALFKGLANSFLGLILIDFIIVSSAILIPTVLMGVTFPIAIRIYAHKTDTLGEGVGRLYSANSVGCIFGAFLAGFYFIPSIGVQKTIVALSGLNLAAAIILIVQSETLRSHIKAVAIPLSVFFYFLTSAVMPTWNVRLLNLGVYFNADLFKGAESHMMGLNRFSDESKLLFYEEGVGGTVAVTEANNHLSIQINGKTDGGTSTVDIPPQIMVSALPLLVHPSPKSVEIIGLGSGISTGTATLFPVDRIECVELLPEVVKANRYFSGFNHNALNDRRVVLLVDDARHHLTYGDGEYDVIISEPSNPWISGVSNLFTLEFFKIAKEKLREGGIMSQWIQLNSIDTNELKILLNTFRNVFPHVSVWASSPQDLVVLGSMKRINLDPSWAENGFSREEIREELKKAGINNLEDLFGRYLMGEREVERFSKGAKLNTDDHPVIEFETPKTLYKTTAWKNLSAIMSSAARINHKP